MEILILEKEDGFSTYVIDKDRNVFLDDYKDLFAAVAGVHRRIEGDIMINVLMLPKDEHKEQDEWQVLEEVQPTQANERK